MPDADAAQWARRHIEADGIILTPNHSWVMQLCEQLVDSVGVHPPVFSIDHWLQEVWNDLSLEGEEPFVSYALLSSFQERALWRYVMEGDGEIQSDAALALSQLCQDAWNRCGLYGLPYSDEQLQGYKFSSWAARFDEICTQRKMLSRTEAMSKLVEHGKRLSLPKNVALYGFVPEQGAGEVEPDPTPLLRDLLKVIMGAEQEPEIFQFPRKPQVDITDAGVYDTVEEQLQVAGRWAHNHPEQSMRLVVPNLRNSALLVRRVLRSHLPQSQWSIQAPTPCSDLAGFAAGYEWLHIALQPISAQRLFIVLDGVGSGDDGEGVWQQERIQYALRRADLVQFTLKTLSQELKALGAQPPLAGVLLSSLKRISKWPEQGSLGEWAGLIRDELAQLFKGREDAGALFAQALDSLWMLEGVLPEQEYSCAQALSWLKWQADGQGAPGVHRDASARVQVQEPLTASSSEVDCIWLIDFDAKNWPAPRRFNALLPANQQSKRHMPGTDATANWNFAVHLFERLHWCGKEVWISRTHGQGESALLHQPHYKRNGGQVGEVKTEKLPVQKFQDDCSSLLLGDEPEQLQDSYVNSLAYLVDDPFAAFVRTRLGAQPLEDAMLPINRMYIGQMLHLALERLHPPGRAANASEADVDRILLDLIPEMPSAFKEPLQTMLRDTLLAWIEFQDGGKVFASGYGVVDAVELALQGVDDFGVSYRVRLDRVENLGGSKRVIIDYKSSVSTPAPVFNKDKELVFTRREQVQLAVYAQAYVQQFPDAQILGVILAGLNPLDDEIKPKFSGVLDASCLDALQVKSRSVVFVNMDQWMEAAAQALHKLKVKRRTPDPYAMPYVSSQQSDPYQLLRPDTGRWAESDE